MGLRRWGHWIVLGLGIEALSACTSNALPEPAPSRRIVPPAAQSEGVPGEYIVTLKADSKDRHEDVRNSYSDFGVIQVKPIGNSRYVLKLERDPGFSAIKLKAEQTPAIESVQPNFKYQTQ